MLSCCSIYSIFPKNPKKNPPQDKGINLATDVNQNLGQANQVKILLEIFGKKKNGFFVEAGAHDGEYLSNTVHLEVSIIFQIM